MNVKKWKKQFRKSLKLCGVKDTFAAESFYDELIDDKLESGDSEELITAKLGDPYSIAEKIAAEESDAKRREDNPNGRNASRVRTKRLSVAAIIGYAFLVVCIGVPLFCAYLGIIVAVVSVSVAGVACSVGGSVSTVALFLVGFFFNSAIKNVLLISCALCLTGVGLLLFVLFAKISALMIKGLIGVFKFTVNVIKKEI